MSKPFFQNKYPNIEIEVVLQAGGSYSNFEVILLILSFRAELSEKPHVF